MRYAARADGNQTEIIQAFRLSGASVYNIKLPVDILVGYAGKTALVEIKDTSTRYGKSGLNANQSEFLKGWNGGTVALIDSIEAAQRLLKLMAS